MRPQSARFSSYLLLCQCHSRVIELEALSQTFFLFKGYIMSSYVVSSSLLKEFSSLRCLTKKSSSAVYSTSRSRRILAGFSAHEIGAGDGPPITSTCHCSMCVSKG